MKFQNVIKSPVFIQNLIKNTEEQLSKTWFDLVEHKHSLNMYVYNSSIDFKNIMKLNEISVQVGRVFEKEFYKTLKSYCVKCKLIDNEIGDILIEGIEYEIKTSRDNGKTHTLQGATHSSSKCNNYIFFRYGLDFNKKLITKTKVNYLINKIHLSIHTGIVFKEYWSGTASHNNSRTVLRIPIEKENDFKNGLIYGNIVPAKKYLQFKTTDFKLNEKIIKENILKNILIF